MTTDAAWFQAIENRHLREENQVLQAALRVQGGALRDAATALVALRRATGGAGAANGAQVAPSTNHDISGAHRGAQRFQGER